MGLIQRILHVDSVGKPQWIAGSLIALYLLQCAWLIRVQTQHGLLPESDHALCIYSGLTQWKGGAIAGTPEALRSEDVTGLPSAGREGHLLVRDGFDTDRSPYYYLVAAVPALVPLPDVPPDSVLGQIWIAAPYLFFGVMMAASLWYVSRRLYGNAGGYIALTLYCFSPGMILAVAGTQNLGEMSGAWGAFGVVFTGIAVAHTLYAPREVVLWNGKRILLLGLSVALAVGTQFSLVAIVIAVLPIMFWVAPVRRRAVMAIWGASIAVALVLLAAGYAFGFRVMWQSLRHARWIDWEWHAFAMSASYAQTLKVLREDCPALILALPAMLIAYAGWKRARYFGNTAPLLIGALLFVLAAASPDFSGRGFQLAAVVFLFVFVAGVFADLIETQQGMLVTAGMASLVGAAGVWNLVELARLR